MNTFPNVHPRCFSLYLSRSFDRSPSLSPIFDFVRIRVRAFLLHTLSLPLSIHNVCIFDILDQSNASYMYGNILLMSNGCEIISCVGDGIYWRIYLLYTDFGTYAFSIHIFMRLHYTLYIMHAQHFSKGDDGINLFRHVITRRR